MTSLLLGFRAISAPTILPLGLLSRYNGGTLPLSVMLHTAIPPLLGASSSPPPALVPTSQPFEGMSRNFPPSPLMTARGFTFPLSVRLKIRTPLLLLTA